MPTQVRAYVRATDVEEALRMLQEPDTAAWLASPRMPDPPVAIAPVLVDVQAISLSAIRVMGDSLIIGGQATLEAVATHPVILGLADGLLAEAARLAAHRGLRNLATVEGTLRNEEGPPELLLALSALGAMLHLQTATGRQETEVYGFLPPRSLLEAVVLPLKKRRGALARVARTPLDQAIVAAVAVGDSSHVAVAVSAEAGTMNMTETTLNNASPARFNALIDSMVETVTEDAMPQGDYRGSVEYRSAMVEVLSRRALTEVLMEGSRA
jgi:CO/xanthine dehydrogenase FAD-binding subunit